MIMQYVRIMRYIIEVGKDADKRRMEEEDKDRGGKDSP